MVGMAAAEPGRAEPGRAREASPPALFPVVGSAPKISLGLALLLGERLRADVGARSAEVGGMPAFALGAASSAATAAGHAAYIVAVKATGSARAAKAAAQRVLSHPIVVRASAPVRPAGAVVRAELANHAGGTAAHGRAVAARARAEALRFLESEATSSLGWVRLRVLPVVFDDLVAEPKVHELVVEQAHGALSDAAREVRTRSASADERLEDGVRRILGRPRPGQERPPSPVSDG